MLSVDQRLHKARDIARVYRKGRLAKSGLFRLSWLANRQTSARVVVITSRKLSTKAVQRNLLKRQVRTILREVVDRLDRVDLIVQLLPSVIRTARAKDRDAARKQVLHTLAYDVLKKDLLELLERQRLLIDLKHGVGSKG